MAVLVLLLWPASMALAADEPDLIFRRSTVFKLLSPNDKPQPMVSMTPRLKA